MGRTSAETGAVSSSGTITAPHALGWLLEKELVSMLPRRKGCGPDGPGGLSNTPDALPSPIRSHLRAATSLGQVCASDADHGGGAEQRAGAPSGSCIKKHLTDRIPPGLQSFSKHTDGKCVLETLWKVGFSEVYKRIC